MMIAYIQILKVLGKGIRKNGHKVNFSATAKSIPRLINMKSIFFFFTEVAM